MSKRYHAPLTPFPRVQAHSALSGSTKQALTAQFETLALLHDIREAQAWLVAQADATPPAETDVSDGRVVGPCPEGLRHAWNEGEVKPTSQRKPPAPRGRRRHDPLAK